MGIVPAPLIAAPEPLRRRYGLFTAASGPVDLPRGGQGGGVRYDPVTCGTAHPYPIGCYGNEPAVPEGGKPRDPADSPVESGVFSVLASIDCGAAGYRAAEFEDRVRRRLEAGEQGAAEFALWTGLDAASGNDLDILNLQDTAEAIFPPENFDLDAVVAGLEDYAYNEQGYGYTAFIHAPVSVAAFAGASNLIVEDGPLKRTPYGSIWVFGGGYPGTGAGGASTFPGGSYIHITGQVQVWRSADVHVFPADQTMDRATNQRLLLAEREYAIGFDCLNGRAEFNPIGQS